MYQISARGKLVQERLRLQREEEERRRIEEEAEAKRLAEIEAKEAEEARKAAEERDRRKQKQKEKIDRQKKEGTYMTKAQKIKAKLAEQRLEAMRAAGMLPADIAAQQQKDADEDDDAAAAADAEPEQGTTNKKGRVVYDNRKRAKGGKRDASFKQHQANNDTATNKGDADEEHDDDDDDDDEEHEEETRQEKDAVQEVQHPEEEEKSTDKAEDKDDDEEEEDDWEKEAETEEEWDADSNDGRFNELNDRLKKVGIDNVNDDEDLIAIEKKKDQERLRQIGLERAERDRIENEKRTKLMAEQEEENRKAALAAQKREEGKRKRLEQEKANLATRSREDLRSPVVVIMGHVDTGKTKLLDKIRKTNVQEGEAGGITQQIGATFFEKKTLEAQTARLNEKEQVQLTIPGMLVIDTPGHESFTNLRSRGSSLCDIAILVVDLMHGLEQQTIESLTMLRKKGVPFVVALNKVDRCYAWKTCKDAPIREALEQQPEGTISEFRSRALEAKVQLQEQGVNSNIYWEMGEEDWTNSDFIPLVPTSAISGEGVQDLLLLLCQIAQRQIWQKLMWCANLQCTVLEVKAIDGLGMTVDVLVVNGYLREGDRAVFCTLDGPIVTEIRGLLTPPPSREMRVKSEYIHHKEVKGALGVKVIGNGLEKVMAGTPVMVCFCVVMSTFLYSEVDFLLTKSLVFETDCWSRGRRGRYQGGSYV